MQFDVWAITFRSLGLPDLCLSNHGHAIGPICRDDSVDNDFVYSPRILWHITALESNKSRASAVREWLFAINAPTDVVDDQLLSSRLSFQAQTNELNWKSKKKTIGEMSIHRNVQFEQHSPRILYEIFSIDIALILSNQWFFHSRQQIGLFRHENLLKWNKKIGKKRPSRASFQPHINNCRDWFAVWRFCRISRFSRQTDNRGHSEVSCGFLKVLGRWQIR